MCWNKINNENDIEHLMKEYCGFHDSCIVSVNYISGAYVDNKGSMAGIDIECSLIMTFESQIYDYDTCPEKSRLELKFVGLRRINLIGLQDRYFSDISEAYIKFYNNRIVWLEHDIDLEKYIEGPFLNEPSMSTVVAADNMFWRFTEKSIT